MSTTLSEASGAEAGGCGPEHQALGDGGRPSPDCQLSRITWTEDLMCGLSNAEEEEEEEEDERASELTFR